AVRARLVLVELLCGTSLVSAPRPLERLLAVAGAFRDAVDDRPLGGPDRPRGGSARRGAPRDKGGCKDACGCRGEVACRCDGTDPRRCDGARDAAERDRYA